MDRQTKLISKVHTMAASVHGSQSLAAVLPQEPGKVYPDLGDWGKPCEKTILGKAGLPCIAYKKPKDQALQPWQQGVNRVLSGIRSRVEHVFARWKAHFKLVNSRYAGLQKVNTYLKGLALAYNFQRLGFLSRLPVLPGHSVPNSGKHASPLGILPRKW